MKTPVLLLLGLLVFSQAAPFIEENLLFEPQVDTEPPPLVPIPELCTQLGLNTAVQVMREFNLYSLLESSPPNGDQFTVFVPTDTAFQDLPQDIINQLMKNKTLLMEALTFHIVQGKEKLFLKDFDNDYLYTTLSGMDMRTNIYNVSDGGKGSKMLYLATGIVISKPDNVATNGIVHVIDDITFLPVRTSAEVINASADLKDVAQLFDKTYLSQDLLSVVAYSHVADGTFYSVGLYNGQHLPNVPNRFNSSLTISISKNKMMVNDAEIITTNFTTAGGVIHGINKVLLPKEP